jgi:L-threonylcarbamoyladenylate synthase
LTTGPAFRLRRAADCLLAGGLIAHPTEAVWGLACLPQFPATVARLLEAKQRHPAKGLILVAHDEHCFEALLAPLSLSQRTHMRESWPGPVSFVVPDPMAWSPEWVRGSHNSVAIRVSRHPLTRELSRLVKGPLITSSANPAGAAPALTALQARRYFGESLDYYLAGATDGESRPSRIIDVISGKTFRE